ncbi:hypothetical protein [Methanotorris formicicus]|uniref:Uncharacterized protein n=1 Tax=Methanotorris formicicus Mc-S-70 TaxID=647171 RepID=H1KX98_9EURY|nr:hypothetical protein [Methanotorris formicicus]EHP88529.1 hypothetical protein MetfoDRAFT_0421 [Methanotorris formicicus Mc-S-70]
MRILQIFKIGVMVLFGILGLSIVYYVEGIYKYLLVLIFIPSILHILLIKSFKKLELFLNYYCLSTFIIVLILLAINNPSYIKNAMLLFMIPIVVLIPSVRVSPQSFIKIFISVFSLWITVAYFKTIGIFAVLLSIFSFVLVYISLYLKNIKKFSNLPIGDLEPSGVFILGAILGLIISAICLMKNNEYLANKIAEYAYFLLVVGVFRAFYEYIKDIRENGDDTHEIY